MTDTAPPAADALLHIDTLDLDAKGVAQRADGKVIFIEGALPGECVEADIRRKKNNWESGTLAALHRASSQRVTPRCPHFGLHQGACGGCKMQHLDATAQVAVKQQALQDQLWHLGKVVPQRMLRPIEGPSWAYRQRARLSVRHVFKKGEVLVGFHERKSRYVTDMRECHVLPEPVSRLLLPLRTLIKSMDAHDRCPQIELACGDAATALVLRHLDPLSEADQHRLRTFGARHGVQWWLQPKGPDTVHPLDPNNAELYYTLPEFDLRLDFLPTDFTQVNADVNRVLVRQALRWLDAQRSDRVIDWFCGLGNFSLPIATRARSVLGIEGSAAMVGRARQNYMANMQRRSGRTLGKAQFVVRDLFQMEPVQLVRDGHADRWLVDPPREGAFALVKALAAIHQARLGAPDAPPLPAEAKDWQPPRRIVYVSCNPATLARDAGLLVHQAGYCCVAAGAINMFPHTAHVESMAVFDRV